MGSCGRASTAIDSTIYSNVPCNSPKFRRTTYNLDTVVKILGRSNVYMRLTVAASYGSSEEIAAGWQGLSGLCPRRLLLSGESIQMAPTTGSSIPRHTPSVDRVA